MKYNIKKYIPKFFVAALMNAPLTSCDDFLSIIPLNDVVLENYWTEEADVTSCVNSCYSQLETADCLKRMLVWGEMRSDNLVTGSGAPLDITQIAEENLLETNGYTKWESFYQCINRCNTVLYYAPSIHEKDPNYTEAELKANIAEVTTLRSLCYFYLIRTFRDVPYVTEPSIDDGQDYRVPAMKFDEVLTHIIADCEAIKDDAVRSYGEDSELNSTRITRYAIYALLADMYLWKGDYNRCIEYCDKVIRYKQDEYEEMLQEESSLDVELYGEYPLISEAPGNSAYGGTAYTRIFGEGISFESIFELNFVDSETKQNEMVRDFYGSVSNDAGQLSGPSYFTTGVEDGTNTYFRKTDSRFLTNMKENNSTLYIRKYVTEGVSYRTTVTTGGLPTVTETTRGQNVGNWIVYRLTDLILMKAEAQIQLAGNVTEGGSLSQEQESLYRSAFSCVSAVWKRANNKRVATTDTLVYDDYATSKMSMENLIMDERQRELMFEGKRWFDLVRLCRRDGSNGRMVDKVLPKFKENTAALRIRLSAQDALYYPYNKDELRANPYLVQNPAYNNESITTNE